MKFTISTDRLKDMVSRSIKGAGINKLIPITSLMAIQLVNNELTLITTDATNYLYINAFDVQGTDFYAVVDADTIARLVSKLTCENVSFEIAEGNWVLNIVGNGKYRVELPLDENGAPIKYPDPYKQYADSVSAESINRTTVEVITETLKPALSTIIDIPCYTAYYVGDKVVATDTYKIAHMNVKLFDEPKLISSRLMDLLSIMKAEKICVTAEDNTLVFSSDDCIVIGKTVDGLEEFAIDPICAIVDTKFEHFCAVPKAELMQALDRLMLFVGPYDRNEVAITFTVNGLQLSSKEANGVEIIDYVASENFIDFTCPIDIQMLYGEIKSIQSDVINIYYGDSSALKFVDGNITIIVAFLEDESEI